MRNISSMGDDDGDICDFLMSFGFTEHELNAVIYELDSFRAIPGTTIRRYLNRIINTIEQYDRPSFLKGVMAGVVIRKAVDALAEPDLTEEEKRIDHEIERLRLGE